MPSETKNISNQNNQMIVNFSLLFQHQQLQQQPSSQSSISSSQSTLPATQSQNPFSTSNKEAGSQDQDMRMVMKLAKTKDELNLESANRDVDMRILGAPHRSKRSKGTERSGTFYTKSESDNFSKNTHHDKANEQINAATRDAYRSQYLKDANVDFDETYGKLKELFLEQKCATN